LMLALFSELSILPKKSGKSSIFTTVGLPNAPKESLSLNGLVMSILLLFFLSYKAN
jgi:hypothetical protein